eukprot:TRINITY_DN65857_c5_g2_i2.p1 TRINITY_DN65857_c5_g2~~TRINITY_DN65857_c5_g2_i2.p1  ORF type:complete len:168 (-),score=93.49 TRINITY_DN65857_c5_g2_i2:193-696(-)
MASDDAEKLPPLRVLVVEDNVFNQVVISNMIRTLGHECVVMENGRMAVNMMTKVFHESVEVQRMRDSPGGISQEWAEHAFATRIDLILMDLYMPVMDGFVATEEIRSLEERIIGDGEHIPIIATTATTDRYDLRRCTQVGMDDYMLKPVRLERLRKLLSAYQELVYY